MLNAFKKEKYQGQISSILNRIIKHLKVCHKFKIAQCQFVQWSTNAPLKRYFLFIFINLNLMWILLNVNFIKCKFKFCRYYNNIYNNECHMIRGKLSPE